MSRWYSFLKFGLVGIVNTGIDFLLFTLLTLGGFPYLLAQIISYSGGLANSYMLNRSWTFQQKGAASKKEVIAFMSVNLITLAVTSVLLSELHQQLDWSLIVSKLVATTVGVGINYVGTRLVFVRDVEFGGEKK
ncbi:GtrA family protein [Priestia koreensis]|uniref:GtrA family protein n=1 Tax=Priestia koreensis TaxID=284581 RepID=UPI0028F73747|nr:GtrA family protein [Priestia koreensis]